jgi:RNA polymerase subunit RPABC4/transcription elongation factor Spt4
MPKELQPITDAIGGAFGSPLVQLAFQAIVVYWVIFWLAASYWAFRDLQLRTDNPVMPYLAAAFVIVFTPILFPAAIVIYRIVRPHEKIDEVYERTLAQEAMLAEIENARSCPTCHRRIDEEWLVCPTCRTRLARVCPNCTRLVGMDWTICAWCGRDFERRDVAAAMVSPAATPAVTAGPAGAAASSGTLAPTSMATPIGTPGAADARGSAAGRTRSSSDVTDRPSGPRTSSPRSPRPSPGSLPER